MTRAAWVVFLKELRENFRDRRTLLTALLFGPLGAPVLFAVLMNVTLERGAERGEEPVEVVVVGREHAPNLVAYLQQQGAAVEERPGVTPETASAAVRRRQAALVLVIPADFGERLRAGQPAAVGLHADSSDTGTAGARSRLASMLQGYSSRTAAQRLQARGLSPLLVQPVAVDLVDVATPASRALLVLGMLSYFIVFATMMGGLYVAIDATAGERERGSLEPLLTNPVPREQIVYAKIASAAVFMSLSLTLTVVGFAVGLRFVRLEELGMSANFGPEVAVGVIAVMLPFVVLGAALMTIVASFTRSYREAQSWLTAVLLVPTVPIIFAAIYQVQPSLSLMWIPSLSQHLAINGWLRDDPLPLVQLAASGAATLLLGLVLAWVAARLYRREAVLG
ncbi:MAG: ABC transporter permease subunit [Steroidobacteraceae bacterium]|jgi:sodium transport system permease protein|nr:ABC transporter permease subunit [Steroidobacteraceae bacterium]